MFSNRMSVSKVWACSWCRCRRSSDRSGRTGEHDAHGSGERRNSIRETTRTVLHRCHQVAAISVFLCPYSFLHVPTLDSLKSREIPPTIFLVLNILTFPQSLLLFLRSLYTIVWTASSLAVDTLACISRVSACSVNACTPLPLAVVHIFKLYLLTYTYLLPHFLTVCGSSQQFNNKAPISVKIRSFSIAYSFQSRDLHILFFFLIKVFATSGWLSFQYCSLRTTGLWTYAGTSQLFESPLWLYRWH